MFACGVGSTREWSFEEAHGETEGGRCLLPPPLLPEPCPQLPPTLRKCPISTQTEAKLEPATSTLFCLNLDNSCCYARITTGIVQWQQLQHCHQTRARVPLFFIHFTSVLWKQFTANMFLRKTKLQASAHVKKLSAFVVFVMCYRELK